MNPLPQYRFIMKDGLKSNPLNEGRAKETKRMLDRSGIDYEMREVTTMEALTLKINRLEQMADNLAMENFELRTDLRQVTIDLSHLKNKLGAK